MPRSKKPSQRSRSSVPVNEIGKEGPMSMSEEMDEKSKDHDEIFANVQEMFSGQLDPDVVHMVLSESEWKVDQAVDVLFDLQGSAGGLAVKPSNKLFEMAQSVFDNKYRIPDSPTGCMNGDKLPCEDQKEVMPSVTHVGNGNHHVSLPNGSESNMRNNKSMSPALDKYAFSKYGLCTFDLPASQLNSIAVPNTGASRSKLSSDQRIITSENPPTEISDPKKVDLHLKAKDLLHEDDPNTHSSISDVFGNGKPLDKHVASAEELREYTLFSHDADAISLISSPKLLHVPSPRARLMNPRSRDNTEAFNSKMPAQSEINSCWPRLQRDNSLTSNSRPKDLRVNFPDAKIPDCGVKVDLNMKVTEPMRQFETQKFEILQSVNVEIPEHKKLFLPDPLCGTVSGMSVEETRGSTSTWSLSADAPEFVPSWASYARNSSPLFTPSSPLSSQHKGGIINPSLQHKGGIINPSSQHKGGLINPSLQHKGGLINPSEMSPPLLSTVQPSYRANTAWPRPSEKLLLSDVIQQATVHKSTSPKQSPRRAALQNVHQEIIENYVNLNQKVMVLLRGCPGSGKSTLARQIKFNGSILTTDDYFMRGNFYEYDQGLIGDAHVWNQRRSEECLKAGISPVIIDNTNSQRWEMKPYVLQALKYQYHIELMEPPTKWRYKARELCKRNSHNVGLESIQRMLQRFEYNVSVEDIINTPETNKSANRPYTHTPSEGRNSPGWCPNSNQPKHGYLNSSGQSVFGQRSSHPSDTGAGNKRSRDVITMVPVTPSGEQRLPREGRVPGLDSDVVIESEEEIYINGDESCNTTSSFPVNSRKQNNIDDDRVKHGPRAVMTSGSGNLTHSAASPPSMSFQNENEFPALHGNSEIRSFQINTMSELPPLAFPPVIPMPPISSSIAENIWSPTVTDSQSFPPQDEAVQSVKNGDENQSTALGEVELEILANIDSELLTADTSSEFDVIEDEFKALIYITPISEDAKAEIQRQLEEKVKLCKLKCQKSDNGCEGVIQTAVNCSHTDTDSTSNSAEINGSKQETASDDSIKVDSADAIMWDSGAPKPRRRPKGHAYLEEHVIQKQVADESNSDTGDDNRQQVNSEVQSLTPQNGKIEWQSSRKTRKRQGRRPTSPLFDAGVKERFMKNEWSFPGFENSDSSEDSSSNTGTNSVQPSSKPESSSLKKVDSFSNTCPRDFNILHCVNQGYKATAIEEEFRLLSIQARDINVGHVANEMDTHRTITERPCLHRSTCTDDLQEEMNEQFGLEFLQTCFRDVPVDDLKDILASCANDVGVSVNILLDWGYDSIGSPDERRKIALHRLQSTDDQPKNLHSLLKLTSEENFVQPQSLTDLCSQTLKRNLSYSDKYIEELLISGSEKQLQIVEQMTMRCERLLSSEAAGEEEGDVWVKEGAVLCLYSDSEDSDVTYSTDNEESATTELDSEGPEKGSALSEMGSQGLVVSTKPTDRLSESSADLCPLSPGSDGSTTVSTPSLAITTSGTTLPSTIDTPSPVSLSLPRDVIHTLEAIFGPVHSESDCAGRDPLRVEIDYMTAEQLHSCVRKAVRLRESSSAAAADVSSVNQTRKERMHSPITVQQQQHVRTTTKRRKRNLDLPSLRGVRTLKNVHRNSSPPFDPNKWHPKHPVNFREILDEEKAKQLSKEEYLKELEASGDTAALSTRLKRQKLQDMFPGVDDAMLDEFFEANGLSLEATRRMMESVLGASKPPKNVMTAEMANQHETRLISIALEKSLQDFHKQKRLPAVLTSEPSPLEFGERLDYHDFRVEAFTHQKLRQECFQKAQDAYRRGMKDVASFYSQQGHLHSEKLREANRRASQRILYYRNSNLDKASTIDLHGLHPEEAVRCLAEILAERQQELSQTSGRQRCHLSVITGRGQHSRGGRSKLLPAVVDFLTKSNYSWSHQATGMVQVTVRG